MTDARLKNNGATSQQADTRLQGGGTTDDRNAKPNDEARQSRAMEDRAVTESRVLSDDERVEMFRSSFIQAALPDLPPIPGYHVCWLTTTNPRDSIHARLRLGYTLIKASDIPGYDLMSLKTGEYAGCIGVNEMIAAKLPETLYQRFMQAVHYDAPLGEDGKITAATEALKEQAARHGAKLVEGDGIQALRQQPPRPVFTG